MTHEKYKSCIASCAECAVECKKCASADLMDSKIEILARCIKLNEDCATFCVVAVGAMVGRSEFANKILSLCAEICNACALECDKHENIEHCKKCADACRANVIECRAASIL